MDFSTEWLSAGLSDLREGTKKLSDMKRNHQGSKAAFSSAVTDLNRRAFDRVFVGEAARECLDKAVFNAEVNPKALGVIACHSEADVVQAVRWAAEHTVPVSVLAGGHDVFGRAFDGSSMVLDIRALSGVVVNRDMRSVQIQGGTLLQHLLSAVPDDLVTVTGMNRSVGLTGFNLAGGYGRLNGRYGLGCDCIQSARIVLSNGEVAIVSRQENPALFWAIRGGGSGFGVVTAVELELHNLPKVLNARIAIPLECAKEALLHCQDLIDAHSEYLSIFALFVTVPGLGPILFLAPLWSGDEPTGEKIFETLSGGFGATVLQSGWMTYRQTFSDEDEQATPKGFHYDLRTLNLSRLKESDIEVFIEAARCFTSPNSVILLHDFHGRASQIPVEDSAFALRTDHFLVEAIAAWAPESTVAAEEHRQWSARFFSALSPEALPGGYTNLIGPAEADRVRLFYGSAAERLRAIKNAVDPQDIFRSGVGRLVV